MRPLARDGKKKKLRYTSKVARWRAPCEHFTVKKEAYLPVGLVSKASPGQVYLFWGTIQEVTPWRAFIQTLTVYTPQDNRLHEVSQAVGGESTLVSHEREASRQMKTGFLSFFFLPFFYHSTSLQKPQNRGLLSCDIFGVFLSTEERRWGYGRENAGESLKRKQLFFLFFFFFLYSKSIEMAAESSIISVCLCR